MKYLTLIPSYTDSCLKDADNNHIDPISLKLSEKYIKKLTDWHSEYRKIIPMSPKERRKNEKKINALDDEGLRLAKELEESLNETSKVKYYSEGKLKFLI